MPITQARVIALLDCITAYHEGFHEALKIIDEEFTLSDLGRQTVQQAANNVRLVVSAALIKNKIENDTIYHIESIRFGPARRKHNERAAQAAHSRRIAAKYKSLHPQDESLPPPHETKSYEEEYPESQTHCMVCMKPLDAPYCGLSPEDLGSGECHQGKRANPNPSII